MKRHLLIEGSSELGLRDADRRSKRHQSRYNRVGPAHIPGVRFVMDTDTTTEYFTVFLSRSVLNKVPVLRDAPASSGSVKRERVGDAIQVDSHLRGTEIGLPGDLWSLLVILKILITPEWDGDALFLDVHERLALANAIKMAEFLGCVDALQEIVGWIRGRWAELHRTHTAAPGDSIQKSDSVPSPEDSAAYMSLCKVMEGLPDSSFSAKDSGGDWPDGALLGLKPTDAMQLPPQLQVKWLRTDCCTLLDLSQPGPSWCPRHWQCLVGCLSAVPALAGLKVALPSSMQDLMQDCARDYRKGYAVHPRFVNQDAVATLHQAAIYVPQLKYLHLVNTPVHPAHMHRLAAALIAFAGSLTHLGLDMVDTGNKQISFYTKLDDRSRGLLKSRGVYSGHSDGVQQPTPTSQSVLFAALSHMLKLKVLIIPWWNVLCSDGAQNAAVLRELPKLSCICVAQWPCHACQHAQHDVQSCSKHPRGLKFRKDDVSVLVGRTGDGVGTATLVQNTDLAAA